MHNVLHVTSTSEGNPQGVASDLANAWRTKILPVLHTSYTFQGVEVEDIATDDAAGFSVGTGGPSAGTVTGDAMPTFVCASVRLKTDRRGRAGAGRFGLGPLIEGWTGAEGPNFLQPAAVSAVDTAVNQFRADLESSGDFAAMTLSVVSYYKGVDLQGKPIKRAAPLISTVVSSSVNSVLGTRLSRHPNR